MKNVAKAPIIPATTTSIAMMPRFVGDRQRRVAVAKADRARKRGTRRGQQANRE